MKAEPSRLIPPKPTENVELFIATGTLSFYLPCCHRLVNWVGYLKFCS